jgi:hypothetical protein
MRLDEQHNDIGICSATPGGRDHGAVQPAAWPEQAGRVDKDQLAVAFQRHTADPGPGGLHLVGDNRDLGPDHAIGQGGFACIGLSDQSDKSGACRHAGLVQGAVAFVHRRWQRAQVSEACANIASIACAAACSAWRLLPAEAAALCPLARRTSMVNRGA